MNCLKKVRTLQANKWWGFAKACQIVSIKHTLNLGVKVSVWIATFVLQLHLDVVLELIIFGENRYYRDFENLSHVNQIHKTSIELRHAIFIWANISEVLQI